jgi:uracil-DNA glycosylase
LNLTSSLETRTLSELYSEIYRCEDCRGIKNPDVVDYFVNGMGKPSSIDYLPITIPVASFGDVVNSKIWVVATNPDGSDRKDALVGLPVTKFGIEQRSLLRDEDVKRIFKFQCDYFKRPKSSWHPYFLNFVELFDGLKVSGQPVSFSAGDVCFVDAIKCPTRKAWMGFVMGSDGKKVWDNCQRIKNRFLDRQIDLHKPKAVIFYGTGSLVKAEKRGQKVLESETFSNGLKLTLRHVYDGESVGRVSVDFSKARFDQLRKNEQQKAREFISQGLETLT